MSNKNTGNQNKTDVKNEDENVPKAFSKHNPLSSSLPGKDKGAEGNAKTPKDNYSYEKKEVVDFQNQRPMKGDEMEGKVNTKMELKPRQGVDAGIKTGRIGFKHEPDYLSEDFTTGIPTYKGVNQLNPNKNQDKELNEREVQTLQDRGSNLYNVDLSSKTQENKNDLKGNTDANSFKKDSYTSKPRTIGAQTKLVYEDIKEDASIIKDKIEQSNLVTGAKKSLGEAKEVVTQKVNKAIETVEEKYEHSKEAIPAMYNNAKESAQRLSKNVGEKIDEVKNSETVRNMEDKVSNLAHGAKDIAVATGDRISHAVKVVSDAISDILFLPPESEDQINEKENAAEIEPLLEDVNLPNKHSTKKDAFIFQGGQHLTKEPKLKAAENYGKIYETIGDSIKDTGKEDEGYKEVLREMDEDHHPTVKIDEIKLADVKKANL
jgi:hypothetical protein